jgi:putative flippase GtrA
MTPTSPRIQRELSRFLKFTVVGTIGAVVDFGTFNLLLTLLHTPYLIAGGISFACAVTNNFLLNRYWTYPDSRAKPVARQAIQFALVNAVGLMIRTPVLAIGEAPMIRFAQWGIDALAAALPSLAAGVASLDPALLGRNLALALAVLIVLFWNFAINRIWTYSDVE